MQKRRETQCKLTSLRIAQFSLSLCTCKRISLTLPIFGSTVPSAKPNELKLPMIRKPSAVELKELQITELSANDSGRISTVVLQKRSDGCSVLPLRKRYLRSRREYQSVMFSKYEQIYFFKLYGCSNINSMRSPGCGRRPQKNDSPKQARCRVCPLYGAIPLLATAAGLLCGQNDGILPNCLSFSF